jgi:hypothetical protein
MKVDASRWWHRLGTVWFLCLWLSEKNPTSCSQKLRGPDFGDMTAWWRFCKRRSQYYLSIKEEFVQICYQKTIRRNFEVRRSIVNSVIFKEKDIFKHEPTNNGNRQWLIQQYTDSLCISIIHVLSDRSLTCLNNSLLLTAYFIPIRNFLIDIPAMAFVPTTILSSHQVFVCLVSHFIVSELSHL